MKKYLMIGASAMVFGATMFTSCSQDKDLYDPYRDIEGFVNKYQQAFISVYGQPAANQDWGFGSSAQSRMTRAIAPDFDFSAAIPQKPTTDQMGAENFKENVDGIDAYTSINGGNGYASGVSYIDSSVGNVNIWGQNNNGGVLYFTGTCDFSGKSFYVAPAIIYLVKNAQVTLDNGFQGESKVYIAEGAKLTINNNIGTGNVSYYIKGGSFEAKNQLVVNGGKEFFVENGNVKVGGLFQVENATYYAKNTPLEIGGVLDLVSRTNQALFYNESGVITCSDKLFNNSSLFYTGSNSSFTEISANGIGVTYNGPQATMTTGVIKVNNSNANGTNGTVLINDGELNGTYLGTEGGAFFQNNGLTTINAANNGYTIVNSNHNTWVNNGTYNTKYFLYNAGSSQVINNCRLNVAEDFDINLGDNPGNSSFQMDSGSGVVTKNLNAGGGFSYMNNGSSFAGGPFYIYMGSGSVFEVQETATINATKENYGFYCTGDDWAVLHANKIQCMPGQENQGFKVTYGGKLAVISETTHFPQGHDGNPTHPYIDFKNGASIENIYAEGFNTNSPSINIPATECNPGFSRGGGGDNDTKSIRILAEDVSATEATDFDFNDVVFDVIANFNGAATVNQVTIKLWAAGGTLPLKINSTEGDGGFEVHSVMGYTDVKTMINTHAKNYAKDPYKWDDDVPMAEETITLAHSISKANFASDVNNYVRVEVQKEIEGRLSWVLLTANQGEPACKIGVPVGTPWALERQNMNSVFPNFQTWVQTADPKNWYNTTQSSLLYNAGLSYLCDHEQH